MNAPDAFVLIKRARTPGICLCCGEELTPCCKPNVGRVYENHTHEMRGWRAKIYADPYMRIRTKAILADRKEEERKG